MEALAERIEEHLICEPLNCNSETFDKYYARKFGVSRSVFNDTLKSILSSRPNSIIRKDYTKVHKKWALVFLVNANYRGELLGETETELINNYNKTHKLIDKSDRTERDTVKQVDKNDRTAKRYKKPGPPPKIKYPDIY
jgi:hypothetical protein